MCLFYVDKNSACIWTVEYLPRVCRFELTLKATSGLPFPSRTGVIHVYPAKTSTRRSNFKNLEKQLSRCEYKADNCTAIQSSGGSEQVKGHYEPFAGS